MKILIAGVVTALALVGFAFSLQLWRDAVHRLIQGLGADGDEDLT